ncbi:sugar phosphorylase [Candidatus Riflebacteria bacterium]
MAKLLTDTMAQQIFQRFKNLYGTRAEACMSRLETLLQNFNPATEDNSSTDTMWNEKDTILITYADMVKKEGEPPLKTLNRFCEERLQDAFNTIHILPFFPYSSDDGFSVIDYRQVKEDYGNWEDVRKMSEKFYLMFDLVLNHASSKSQWFLDYQNGNEPYCDFFIEVEPESDLSAVVRPRSLPLLTSVKTPAAEKKVWTTFSSDQVDLNFANPDVLFEFLDIMLFYVNQGARVLRLDAIAYLWKKIGSSCIHLQETHEVVKLFRDVLQLLASRVILLTETNVPHRENISYFGEGDEAHMVYQFSLPPLLFYTLTFANSEKLTAWADSLKELPAGCTYLNFSASHDGVGMRPLEGLVADAERELLFKKAADRGGQISTKRNQDGSDSPYELNITYFDLLCGAKEQVVPLALLRFLCSQTIVLELKGIPAVYFHSLTATRNWVAGMKKTGAARTLNRRKWQEEELENILNDPSSVTHKVFKEYCRLLKLRRLQKAFHPEAEQKVHNIGTGFFAVERISRDAEQTILCVSNITGDDLSLPLQDISTIKQAKEWADLLNDSITTTFSENSTIGLQPYQTVWLSDVI